MPNSQDTCDWGQIKPSDPRLAFEQMAERRRLFLRSFQHFLATIDEPLDARVEVEGTCSVLQQFLQIRFEGSE